MVIMSHIDVPEIDFDVHDSVKTLHVLRCEHEKDPDGQPAINGSARFANASLSNWTEKRRKGKKLYIGYGVVIRATASNLSSWASSTSDLSSSQRQSIESYLNLMDQTDMRTSWWKEWKGLVASIVGIGVTSTKLAIAAKATASGFYFSMNLLGVGSLQLGTLKAAASVVATPAGPAVLLGATTAAAFYFID
ncbi:hypothetical protein NLU13_8031 [Sarocladium strictum]|uniref:Uncharacterized protein n=1 Tax=Sarocladium strictum TaxID=5046 RepID=A0AA39GAX2_SARSR|nr:hypothetical protein NLU13_8031 [Sarocladium strictum]